MNELNKVINSIEISNSEHNRLTILLFLNIVKDSDVEDFEKLFIKITKFEILRVSKVTFHLIPFKMQYLVRFEFNYDWHLDSDNDFYYNLILIDLTHIIDIIEALDPQNFEELSYFILEQLSSGYFGKKLDEIHIKLKPSIIHHMSKKFQNKNSEFFKLASEIFKL